jgi:hypothetical protein
MRTKISAPCRVCGSYYLNLRSSTICNTCGAAIPERLEPPHVYYKRKWDLFDFLLIGLAALWTIVLVGLFAIRLGFAP